MINLFLLIWSIIALVESQPCNSIIINGCGSYDTANSYALVDCGCLSCDPGLTLAIGQLSCCDSTYQHCITCDSSNVCQTCEQNYYINSSNYCTLCNNSIANCLTCSNSSICTACFTNFTLDSGVCSPCSTLIPNCITCSSNSVCSTCQSTFALTSNNSCQACSASFGNCSTCSLSNCTLCANGYGFDSSRSCVKCQLSIPNCFRCYETNSTCLTCNFGFFINSTTLQCDLCRSYIYKCNSCPDKTYCNVCDPGFGFNDTHDCVECILYLDNCSSCQNIHTCSSCINNMTFNDSRVCVPCYQYMPYCNLCWSSRQYCGSCNVTGMGVNFTANPDECVPCSPSLSYCVSCTLITYCTACTNNSYIKIWQASDIQYCLPCNSFIQGCNTCTSTTVCSSCLTTKQYLLNATSRICIRCSQYLNNCSTCNSTVYCLKCQDYRFALVHLNNRQSQVCQPCSSFMLNCLYCQSSTFCSLCLAGQLLTTNKGCSGVIGCMEINPMAPVATNCISCDPISFKTTPEDGKCICQRGKVVGNQCTSVIGCTGVKVIRSRVVCISCDKTSKFQLLGEMCQCVPFYELYGETCVETCGDGFLISYQCDDGNRVNGDGCSDKCEIQRLFVCRSDNDRYPASPASECQYKGKIQLVLSSVDKTLQPNTAQVIFDIVPFDPKLQLMDLMAAFNLTADACTVVNIQIVSSQLHVSFEYAKDIEGQASVISAKFDPQYVLSPDFTLNFSMVESNGIALRYNPNEAINKAVILMAKVLSLLALGVFVVGSFAFKLIGLETLYTIQIIWFTLATSKYYKSMFAHFQNLNYSYGQVSSFISSGTIVSINGYKRLGFGGGIGDYFLLTTVDFTIFSCYCGVLIYQSIQKYKLQVIESEKTIYTASKFELLTNEYQQKINKIGKIANSIYNWALFPLAIGFQFHFFHTISIHIIDSPHSQVSVQTGILCLSLMITSYLFFREIIVRNQEYQSIMLRRANKNIYIPNFLVYNLIIFFLLSLLLTNIKQLVYFTIIAIVAFQIIYVVIFTPYNSHFDNFCLILNHIAVLFNLAWIIMKGLPFYDSFIEYLCVYAFIGLCYSVVGLGFIRSLIAIKRTYFPNSSLILNSSSSHPNKASVIIAQKMLDNSKLSIQTHCIDQLKDSSPFRKKIDRYRVDESMLTQRHSFRHKYTQALMDHS